jgi:hypothetical protein
MSEPKNILRTYEKVDIPVSSSGVHTYVRTATWVIVGVIIIGSLIFQSNLLSEMSWTSRMILIALAIGISFWGPKTNPTPSEIEVWFYDDYFVVYRNKRYYSPKVTHREFNKFYYNDVSGMDYDCRTHRFNIHGKIDATFFKYDKGGNVPNTPYYHKVTDGGICYFYIINNDAEIIISTMEQYVGKKVSYRNNREEQK